MSVSAVPQNPAASGPWARVQELVLPVAMIASILVILVPLPAGLMDLLLAANITVAVIMLLTTLYVRTPLEFNIFPSLLLATTLFRLVLNVATTRLILTRASHDGLYAAGGVVRTFGEFVTGGSTGADKIVVGLVIFSIIVLIQFVVITKGATRISEVAARFTLDGMPGRQMAIDADLSAGLIDQREAQRRRMDIGRQADFFGAMDGASKFVRGDAVAGLAIILINIVGGLAIGIVQWGMSPAQAASLFTTLTIGDGLVSQVPAFLIALAAGLLVTRSSQQSNLPKEFLQQLFSRPLALATAGGFLAVLTLTSLPRAPLLAIGAGCVGMAVVLSRRENRARTETSAKQRVENAKKEQRVEDYLAVDPMELELGIGLIRWADRRRGGDLLDRVQRVRQSLAAQIGVIMPKVRIRDNMRLEPNQFRIKIADVAVFRGAIDDASHVEPAAEIASQLSETVRRHADELLTRDAVKHLIDQLRETSPAVVDELIPGLMKLGEVQQVLQELLREQVPIRPLGPILEALGDAAPRTKDPAALVEIVRRRLARTISSRWRDADGRLRVVALDPALEDRLRDCPGRGDEARSICRSIGRAIEKLDSDGRAPVVLVAPDVRPTLKRLTAAAIPQLIVLSHDEITPDTRIESVALAEDVGVPAPHFHSAAASQYPIQSLSPTP